MELGWFANKSRLFRWVYLISGWRPASSFTSLSTACSRSALLKEWSHTELGVGVSKKQCQDTVLETWCNRHPITFTSSLCKGTQQDGVRGYKRTYQNEFYIIKNIYARTRPKRLLSIIKDYSPVPSFYGWRDGNLEKLGNLPKLTKLAFFTDNVIHLPLNSSGDTVSVPYRNIGRGCPNFT